MSEEEIERKQENIYKTWRSIKKRENSLLYNALRSIHEDSTFVAEIAQLWPDLPLVANLRCGLWYSSRFHSTCYFKSTDGHPNNCSFSTTRLNLHLPLLAGQRGGCIVVDSTRKGKRFPDSMSRTIPIWACVLNRAIANRLRRGPEEDRQRRPRGDDSDLEPSCLIADENAKVANWDCSLHLPLWISRTERAVIEGRIDEWVKQLEGSGADIDSLVASLRKPLRSLWISQKTVIWLNEVPGIDSWDFTPIILVSASSSQGQGIIRQSSLSEFSWHYIPGAGDDEESWARGLTPELFWKNVYEIIHWGPDLCNQKIAELVEKDRVYRGWRGENAPQVMLKNQKQQRSRNWDANSQDLEFHVLADSSSAEPCSFFWVGSTDIAVCSHSCAENLPAAVEYCMLNCDLQNGYVHSSSYSSYLHLPIQASKVERFSLLNNLPFAVDFATLHLNSGKKLVVCCCNGEDISVCVILGILASLFDEEGNFDRGLHFMKSSISKLDIRKRLTFICKFAVSARPSRGNLRQVFNFLCRRKESLVSASSIGSASELPLPQVGKISA